MLMPNIYFFLGQILLKCQSLWSFKCVNVKIIRHILKRIKGIWESQESIWISILDQYHNNSKNIGCRPIFDISHSLYIQTYEEKKLVPICKEFLSFFFLLNSVKNCDFARFYKFQNFIKSLIFFELIEINKAKWIMTVCIAALTLFSYH